MIAFHIKSATGYAASEETEVGSWTILAASFQTLGFVLPQHCVVCDAGVACDCSVAAEWLPGADGRNMGYAALLLRSDCACVCVSVPVCLCVCLSVFLP